MARCAKRNSGDVRQLHRDDVARADALLPAGPRDAAARGRSARARSDVAGAQATAGAVGTLGGMARAAISPACRRRATSRAPCIRARRDSRSRVAPSAPILSAWKKRLILVAGAVRAEHRLPHPVPDDHHRPRLAPGLFPHPLSSARATRPWLRDLQAVGEGLRAHLRDGRGDGRDDELPVRHQLAGLHEHGRQHRRAAARLRGAHRVLPRGDLPRRDALRHGARARAGVHVASALIVAVGTTVSAFWILALNSWMQTPAGHVLDGGQCIAGELARR